MRRIKWRSVIRGSGAAFGKLLDEGDHPGRGKDGVRPPCRLRGMASRPADMGDKLHAALMAADRRHAGGLANDRDPRRGAASRQKGRHPLGPEAADFLIEGKGKPERFGQRPGTRLECRRLCQRHGKKALHVDSAAPIKEPVFASQPPRIITPAGSPRRHHIKMPGQQYAALGAGAFLRANPRQQVEPLAILMRVPPAGDAMIAKPGFDKGHNPVIRLQADAGEAHQVGKQGDGTLAKRVRGGVHPLTT